MIRANQIGERGGSKLKLIMTLAILAAMVFGAVKIVPVYFANYQFQDAIESESRFALTGYPKRSPDDIRDDIMKKAQELDIPLQPDNIQVTVGNGTVDIAVNYSVTFDLAVYNWTHQFQPHADNHTI
jgi:anionic cell wall polymer biosynthesis LytR-Cps2A-Psr (LCP) family protein